MMNYLNIDRYNFHNIRLTIVIGPLYFDTYFAHSRTYTSLCNACLSSDPHHQTKRVKTRDGYNARAIKDKNITTTTADKASISNSALCPN